MFAAAAKLFGEDDEDFFGSQVDLSAQDSDRFDNDFEEATKRFHGWSTGESSGDNVYYNSNTGADLGEQFVSSDDQWYGLPDLGLSDARRGSGYPDSVGTKRSPEFSERSHRSYETARLWNSEDIPARKKQKPERFQGSRSNQKYQKYPALGGSGEESRPSNELKKFVFKPVPSTEDPAPPPKKYVLLDKPNKRKLFNASSRPLEL